MTALNQWPDTLPIQRRESLIRLIYQKTEDESKREQWLNELEMAGESDALEMENLLNA